MQFEHIPTNVLTYFPFRSDKFIVCRYITVWNKNATIQITLRIYCEYRYECSNNLFIIWVNGTLAATRNRLSGFELTAVCKGKYLIEYPNYLVISMYVPTRDISKD